MGKKTPKYIVFNKNMGGRFHRPVSGGDDLKLLRTYYNGDAYEIVRTGGMVMVIANLIVVSLFTVIATLLKIFGIAFTDLSWWYLWIPEVAMIVFYATVFSVIERHVSKKSKHDTPVFVETMLPRKAVRYDPHILKARAQTKRALNARKYAALVMDIVNKGARNGELEFSIDLTDVPYADLKGLGESGNIASYGSEIAEIIKAKGLKVTFKQRADNILFSGYSYLDIEL